MKLIAYPTEYNQVYCKNGIYSIASLSHFFLVRTCLITNRKHVIFNMNII